ncbi:NAD(P)-dependent oxidoreductase [Rhizobium sp. SG570]|uniref:NAD(P)-dependent oxidoreductase n=1 Tax=Rhizobium sp. SG570 TaxID=2587113 RepID=UPI001447D108|nr:NAD(P)-dependent oxidoreductase [Rhizobium sp. SG570]NKJ40425.1 D-3-phosphoglycerate dehydrogenase [Rhizobium sp. SG570]
MRCLIVQPVHADGLDLLRQAGVEPVLCPKPDTETVARMIVGCDAAITRDAGLSGAAIEASDCLRVIVVHGAGHDAVDKDAASRKGVLVCNTPGANARSVSELALALALAAARRISAADRSERAGLHGLRERETFSELSGKTALIIGFGATGAGLAHMLKAALNMRVLVYSPRISDLQGFERAGSLGAGLSRADLVSLHTPLRPETRHLIGEEALSVVKHGAILVNTARAGLVDEAALAAAIEVGRISAAGLDVYSDDAPRGPLAASDRVIFTPHLGGATEEALRRVAVGSARNVLTALSGERPATALNNPAEIAA